jgi:hypothetical protein
MGTARWERENAEAQEIERLRSELEVKRREVSKVEADIQARMVALKRELEDRQNELTFLTKEQEAKEKRMMTSRQSRLEVREGHTR